jgi:soluble cytochrome b562
MKSLYTIFASMLLVFALQTATLAQTTNITETFKKHFNETVQAVHSTDNADEKRAILNESFNKMISAIDRIESQAPLTEDESAKITSYKLGLTEILNELNGLDGFDKTTDENLDEFSDYSQDYIEQANNTITISVVTVILIAIILLLL